MITNESLRLIQDVANSTKITDWKKLETDNDGIGGVACTCTEKLLVVALTRETSLSLVAEVLDHRARVQYVEADDAILFLEEAIDNLVKFLRIGNVSGHKILLASVAIETLKATIMLLKGLEE